MNCYTSKKYSQIVSMFPHTLPVEPLSQCHPLRHPFTERMRQWQPMRTVLSHPQLFGPGSTNQGRLPCAPDPVSGWGQPITDVPAHLMHCGPFASCRQTPTQVLWIQAISLTSQPIRCIFSLSHEAWQTLSFCILSSVYHYVCVCACI